MPDRRGPALIVNTASRRGRKLLRPAVEALRIAGIDPDAIALVGTTKAARAAAYKALQDGHRTVIAGGGDGTLGAVADEVAEAGATLGVMPMGTGNAFCRDLGILSLDDAIEAIAAGDTAQVDLGWVEGYGAFLNIASVGLGSYIAAHLRGAPKGVLGPLAYIAPVLRSVRLVRPFQARLELDGNAHDLAAYHLVIGNGRTHAGPFPIASGAGLSSGNLSLYAVTDGRPNALLRYVLALARGAHDQLPEVIKWTGSAGTLETRPRRAVVIDGELARRTPMAFASRPSKLTVICRAEA